MKSDVIDYKIIGNDLQIVEIELDPNETVIAEAGALNYMDSDILFETKMGDGSQPEAGFFNNFISSAKRVLAGESAFITHFTNRGMKKSVIAFSAPYPGSIIPINLNEYNNEFICQKDAFLCAALGTKIDITFVKKLGNGFFGGEGFILEKLSGDGLAFLHAGGCIVKKVLNDEKIKVDTGCIVGFSSGIKYGIEKTGDLISMMFGGEGIFLATLEGKGVVYLQSLPFSRLADKIIQNAPSLGGKSTGESSFFNGFSDFFNNK